MDLNETTTLSPVSVSRRSEVRQKIELWSLVLEAVHIDHHIDSELGGWVIHVAPQDYDAAWQQVSIFEEENKNWPPSPPPAEAMGSDDFSTLIFMVSLVLFFSLTGPWNEQSRWFVEGAVSAEKIFGSGEWWRLITGLTLHADAAHLMGNVFFGGLLLYFLSSQLGSGTGWLIALLSGGGGNLLNVWFRQGGHLSVGFSTAVFGMVGAFCGLRWFRRGINVKEFLLPVGASAALLAFMGSSGERTDLGAHFWGMAVGLILGGVASRSKIKEFLAFKFVQFFLLTLCAAGVCLAWALALGSV